MITICEQFAEKKVLEQTLCYEYSDPVCSELKLRAFGICNSNCVSGDDDTRLTQHLNGAWHC